MMSFAFSNINLSSSYVSFFKAELTALPKTKSVFFPFLNSVRLSKYTSSLFFSFVVWILSSHLQPSSVNLALNNVLKSVILRTEFLLLSEAFSIILIINGKIIWKQGPNVQINMLRTKLYQNPILSTLHQKVNKPKIRVAGLFLDRPFTFFLI